MEKEQNIQNIDIQDIRKKLEQMLMKNSSQINYDLMQENVNKDSKQSVFKSLNSTIQSDE